MAQRITADTTVAASATTVYGVITDVTGYPTWAPDVVSATVLERDQDQLPALVRFAVDARVARIEYTLRYQHDAPNRVRWRLAEAVMLDQLDGQYTLSPTDGGTRVDYAVEASLALPVPGYVERRATRAIVHAGLEGLRTRAEELA